MIANIDLVAAQLRDDAGFGSGNFIFKLGEGPGYGCPTVHLDEPLQLATGVIPHQLSVADIRHFGEVIATWYSAQGVQPKDPVGLWFDDSILYFLHYVALTRIGAIPVFVNGSLAPTITIDFIRRVGARLTVSQAERIDTLQKAANGPLPFELIDVDAINLHGIVQYEAFEHAPNDPVLIGHSSGTTGTPKAVRFDHQGFIFGVKQEITRMVGRRIMTALPHSHASAISILMSALIRGCAVKVQAKKTSEDILRAIEAFQPDLFCSFPKVYVELCRADLDSWDLDSIQYWLSTGDANHEAHIKRLMSFGSHFHQGTWFPGSCFIDNLGASELGFAAFRNVHRPGHAKGQFNRCIGRPFSWVNAAVLDSHGRPMGTGEVGYLGIIAGSVTPGYWNDSLLSEKNRLRGYWLTGDLVFKDAEGQFFHVDRTSDSLKTRQGMLYSCQAEELIMKNCPEVFDCSIVGVADPDGDAGLVKPVLTADVSTDAGITEPALLSKINAVFVKHGLPLISKVIFESAHHDTGVTGKKLKRVMRTRLSETAGN